MEIVKIFVPTYRIHNLKLASPHISSSWGNIPTILPEIIDRFNIKIDNAIEFGVEFGYSTSALANLFANVVGIDTFTGDEHAGFYGNILHLTKSYLEEHSNIELIQSTYQEFIKTHDKHYNLAHVDIVHTYEDTYACGEWCINHADIVIFHDTLSFANVMQACKDLALKYDRHFYNYEESHGLGILVKK